VRPHAVWGPTRNLDVGDDLALKGSSWKPPRIRRARSRRLDQGTSKNSINGSALTLQKGPGPGTGNRDRAHSARNREPGTADRRPSPPTKAGDRCQRAGNRSLNWLGSRTRVRVTGSRGDSLGSFASAYSCKTLAFPSYRRLARTQNVERTMIATMSATQVAAHELGKRCRVDERRWSDVQR